MSPRIITLTLNPTIDVACDAKDRVDPVHKVRCRGETYDPGGGGVNVGRVLRELDADVLSVITAGDKTGDMLKELMENAGVASLAVPIRDRTRISWTVHEVATGQEYRFVTEGPMLAEQEWQATLDAVDAAEGTWIVASGGLPRGVPEDYYARLARCAASKGRQVVLDTSGAALHAARGVKLALMKPSLRELRELVDRKLPDDASQEAAALGLIREGEVERIAVTLGADGAFLATAEGVWRLPALDVRVRGTVGSGDSFVAAMTIALARGDTEPKALAMGVAAGAAAVMTSGTAHPTKAQIEAQFRRVPPASYRPWQ
jgi:6-phosphofructokinase 2